MPFLPNGMSTINRLSETFMHRFYSALCAIAAAVLLGACDKPGTSAPSNAGPATGDPTPISNLPIADLSDEQLQDRWNRLAVTLSLEKMNLHGCKPTAAPAGKTTITCFSAPRSVVYIVRTHGKVTQVQFTSLLGFFSVSLAESSKFMARFLHEGTRGDDASLLSQFQQEASRNKRFCVPSAATQSQMCYLTDGRSYGVEIR